MSDIKKLIEQADKKKLYELLHRVRFKCSRIYVAKTMEVKVTIPNELVNEIEDILLGHNWREELK